MLEIVSERISKFFSSVKAGIKVVIFLSWTAVLLVMLTISLPFGGRLFFARLWHRVCLYIFSVKINMKGLVVKNNPMLYVANHVSYLDINILGAFLPALFVSKAEVRSWPLFGWLSTFQNTVFVNRRSREIRVQLKQLSQRITENDSLVIFPEGTSTDGKAIKPFKSSLFAICELHPELSIQAISMRYKDIKGNPLSDKERDQYAFYADFPFGLHFWNMLKGRGVQVDLNFSQSFDASHFEDRKGLSKAMQDEVDILLNQ